MKNLKIKIFIISLSTQRFKLILDSLDKAQEEIQNFILKCKNSEKQKGYISRNFYEIILNSNYKFLSGISNKVFKIIELQTVLKF